MAEAGGDASRLTARIEPLYTEGAFVRYPFLGVKLYHPKRASLNAHHTTSACLGVNQNHAILPLCYGVFRTSLQAARSAAMQAMSYNVSRLWFALYIPRNILVNRYPIRANRKIMLLLASDFTGMTANTCHSVHNKRVFLDHHFSSSAR
jgi:hypothetical protein